jgi:hypothetical protein
MPKRNRGEEGAATEQTRATGERITEIMRLLSPGAALGEVTRLLSVEEFRDLIHKRSKVLIGASTLTRYAKGEREAPPSVLEAIATVDPLHRGPSWLAGWRPDAQQSQNSVAPTPQNGDAARLPPSMPMPPWVDPAAVKPHHKKRRA